MSSLRLRSSQFNQGRSTSDSRRAGVRAQLGRATFLSFYSLQAQYAEEMTVDFKNPHDEVEEISAFVQPQIDDIGSAATHPYTCLSCSLAFTDTASQREHYATDLHRYNSKRRVAGLGPVTIELYNEKVLSSRVEPTEETAAGRLSCKACK